MGRDARKEQVALERGRKGKPSIWLALSPEQNHGTALEQALGAAAVSADRGLPHVAS